jgi:BirA family biotin operon repressor/biotin-[acetyl-CoA-carboxylase] ligase
MLLKGFQELVAFQDISSPSERSILGREATVLTSPPLFARDPVTSDAVLPLLLGLLEPGAPWVAGLPYEYLPECASTNAALKEAAAHTHTGAVLVTDEQTSGRGRLGRSWLSEPGADLTFSVLLRPRLEPDKAHLLALATGVAVAQVLEDAFQLQGQVSLKWPNDVLLGGRKVCGILLEGSMKSEQLVWAVAGIGLNVNSEPAAMVAGLSAADRAEWSGRPEPVSLREHLGVPVLRAPLLAALLARLTGWWTGLEWLGTVASLLGEWRCRDALVGRPLEVFSGADRSELAAAGVGAGIGEEGQLLVRDAAGCITEVFAGDTSVVAQSI